MAFLDKLTKTISETADKVSDAAKNIDKEQLKLDAAKAAMDTLSKAKDTSVAMANSVTNTAKQIDPKDIPGSLTKMADNAGKAIIKHNEERIETQAAAKEILTKKAANEPQMTVHDALAMIYLLMNVDGQYSQEEEAVFNSAGKEINLQFNESKDSLVKECQEIVNKAQNGDFLENIRQALEELMIHSSKETDQTIGGRLMVWNLIAAAYADGLCSKEEHELILYVTEQLHVAEDVEMEMEAAMKTMLAVNREEQWLNDSNRPFRTIQPQMEEVKKRKENIMQGVQALLKD